MKINRPSCPPLLLAGLVLHPGFAQENNPPPDGFDPVQR